MLTVTEIYKNNIYASARKIISKAEFELLDVDANTDASASVSGECSFSKKDQLFNQVRDINGKFSTFEDDYWKLDGTFVLPPKSTETGYEIGWWSDVLSGASGIFTVPPTLTINFTKDHSAIGITITFDTVANQYAEEFDIECYDLSDVLIESVSVTGNTLNKYIWENNILNFRKIVITINKTNLPYRRARICEVDFGIIKEYTENEIISLDALEEVDSVSNTVTSNEIKLVLDNQSKEFNILNPDGIYPYLQRKQKLKPYYGLYISDELTEFIPLGVYYLTNWSSDEGAMTASFTARDILDLLAQSTYRKGVIQTISLYDLAVDVLEDGGITDYTIDADLDAVTTSGCLPLTTHRQALQIIALAAQAVIYADRFGRVIIKQLSDTALDENIDFDNVSREPKIELEKLVNTIDVMVSGYVAKDASEKIHESTIGINGTLDVWCDYKSSPAQSVTASVTGGTLNSATYYANTALLNITASGNVSIEITGTVLERSQTVYKLVDTSIPEGEKTIALKVDNPLITSTDLAEDVAQWILAEYQKRFLYEINWRQNPALEAGDIVVVEDAYGENKPVRIIKNEFKYSGFLGGKTNGKGG